MESGLAVSVTLIVFLSTEDVPPVGGDRSLRLREVIMGIPKNGIEYLEGSVVSNSLNYTEVALSQLSFFAIQPMVSQERKYKGKYPPTKRAPVRLAPSDAHLSRASSF